jgi:uncharacterized protein YutE (UPF0331/DUF86 family)
LGRHGVIDDDLAGRLALATGFRDVLVRACVDVDDDPAVARLDELDDLQGFIDQVRDWASHQA